MMEECTMQICDWGVGQGNLQSPIADRQSEIMSITSRLSAALGDRYRLKRYLGGGGVSTVHLG